MDFALNQSPRGGGRGGRAGRGGRGRTGVTTEVPAAVADTGAGVGVAPVEEEFAVPDGNPHGLPAEDPAPLNMTLHSRAEERAGIAAGFAAAEQRAADGDGSPAEEPAASPPPRLSPPPGWAVAADGRFMPPPGLPIASPQSTVVAAWAVHRQLSRLASDLVLNDLPRARTRHGA